MRKKIILIQSKKGGIGKSWITLQLAHSLAFKTKKKILVLTTDKQNDILTFSGSEATLKRGLEYWLEHLDGDVAELRKNLYYIPLNTVEISKENLNSKFRPFLEVLQSKFDYILIDGTPVIELNDIISEYATDIVIPTFLDKVTTLGMMEMIKKFDLDRIRAVIPNRTTSRSSLEKEYYEKLKNSLQKTKIVIACPINQSTIISRMIEKGKTIWDTESKKVETIKESFNDVIKVIR